VAHLTTEHPQVRAWPDDNPDLAHQLDHRDWIYDHQHRMAERAAEQAFDRLNPAFGVPADHADRIGHRDVQQREAALALGIRVAVHDSRQNDRDPVVWQRGQGLPGRRGHPGRPHPAHPHSLGSGAGRPRTLTSISNRQHKE
jgi:hypothetical protein